MTAKPKPYAPRPWQLPHLLATPLGGTVLLVERCKEQPPPCKGFPREANGEWGIYLDRPHAGPYKHIGKCPLGPVGTALAVKEAWAEGEDEFNLPVVAYRDGHARYLHPETERPTSKSPVGVTYEIDLWRSARSMPLKYCRLFFRTTGIDLRKTDTIAEQEAGIAGCSGWYTAPHPDFGETDGCLPSEQFEEYWLSDNHGAKWGDWAWFITAERVERT